MSSTATPPHLFALDAPVRSFMRPGVVTVSEDTSLRQVQRAMLSHGVRAVLVNGRSRGWVTSRGLLAHLSEDLALVPAGSAISEPTTVIEPGATAAEALQALRDPRVSHLLVARTEHGPAEGVVSDLDLVRLTAA